MASLNSFQSQGQLTVGTQTYGIFRLSRLEELGLTQVARLPYALRVLLENALRNEDGRLVTESDVKHLARYDAAQVSHQEIPYLPARVVLQDFTGIPAVVDDSAQNAGGR